jgi:hypothetical protein
LAASQKRPKQQAAKLQAGLLAAKSAPGSGTGTAEQASPEQAASAAPPKKAISADDILYRKGDATAATFRPWYWSYERPGEKGDMPAHDSAGAPTPEGEAPSSDAKILQEHLSEAAATPLVTEAPPPTAEAPPATTEAPPPSAAPVDSPAAPEIRIDDQPVLSAEPAAVEAPQAGAEAAAPESRTDDHAVPVAEPPAIEEPKATPDDQPILSTEPPAIEGAQAPDTPLVPEVRTEDQAALPAEPPSLDAPPPEPEPAPKPPEVRAERPHQRARRALREHAAVAEAAAAPVPAPKRRKAAQDDHAAAPPAPPAEERAAALAAEERAAQERATALAEKEERAALARAAEDASAATPEELATTIETMMNRRRYTDPAEPEKAARKGSGHTITGNSLLAELQAAREARGSEGPKMQRESDTGSSIVSSRSLLDRVLTYGGIALILAVALLALSPAAQYAPVARLTRLFN